MVLANSASAVDFSTDSVDPSVKDFDSPAEASAMCLSAFLQVRVFL